MRAAGLDVGGSSVKAWVADDHGVIGRGRAEYRTLAPAAHRAEFDPEELWSAARAALDAAFAGAGAGAVDGITLTSLRQGFVLLGDDGELGAGVLNSDRRGASHLAMVSDRIGVESLYRITGHWPAPELTLPKLLHLADREPDRWNATRHVLFVHDWLAWRLCGELACETSFASAGQLADVGARTWAEDIIDQFSLGRSRFPALVESGTTLGHVTAAAADAMPGLRAGTPVIAGAGDTQVAAFGLGGLTAGTATVIAGSSTPVQAATNTPVRDPDRRPWVSTHLRPDLWAAETNAGYPGAMYDWVRHVLGRPTSDDGTALPGRPGAGGVTAVVATPHWTQDAWAVKAPRALIGFTTATSTDDLARAVLEAHAYAIRSNIADLHDCLPGGVDTVVLGGGAAQPALTQLIADVLGRPVLVSREPMPAAAAGASLVRRALDGVDRPPRPQLAEVSPSGTDLYEAPYRRFLDAHDALHRDLPDHHG